MPFTIGLGRNSPIDIESNPLKFEGLIVRHGQWVRWTTAHKCSCVLDNNRPDPRCTTCRGSGWVYSFQNTEEDLAVEAYAVDTNLIEMSYDLADSTVSLVEDGAGTIYSIEAVYGKWIKVSGNPFSLGALVYVSVSNERSAVLDGVAATYRGNGLVQLNAPTYQNPWANIPCDITLVSSIKDAAGKTYTVIDYAADKIVIDVSVSAPATRAAMVVSGKYMPPYKIAVLNQAMSPMDQKYIQDIGGDALAVFPFAYKVSEQDLIQLWAGTQIKKHILAKRAGDTDVLPDLFVSRVVLLADKTTTYTEGTDFVIWNRNTIRWLTTNRPASGANYSIEYAANLAYKVISQLPNVRASENKRFPSRVALKLQSGLGSDDMTTLKPISAGTDLL